jgi:tripartite-type tricarboxylate transporter receptor subunit TctC
MRLRAALATAVLALPAAPVPAQGYPARPVTVLVPYAPGGTSDITTRILAQRLSDALGRQFIVENRPGGGGVIGWSAGAKAVPDGYTLLALETGFSMAPGLLPSLPFDPRRDFIHISETAAVPFVMVVHPSMPVATVPQFIALARTHPAKINYASAGNGSSTHLGAEWFRSFAKIDFVHVPYKGGGPANQAVLSGEAQVAFPAVPSAMSFIKSGRLKALMVTADKRLAALPGVASAPEAGLPKMIGNNWFAMAAPAKTPPEIIALLHKELVAAASHPATRERFTELGLGVVGSSPAQAAKMIDEEIQRWTALVKAANIKPD